MDETQNIDGCIIYRHLLGNVKVTRVECGFYCYADVSVVNFKFKIKVYILLSLRLDTYMVYIAANNQPLYIFFLFAFSRSVTESA